MTMEVVRSNTTYASCHPAHTCVLSLIWSLDGMTHLLVSQPSMIMAIEEILFALMFWKVVLVA